MEVKDGICTGCGQQRDDIAQYHPIECCISFKAGYEQGMKTQATPRTDLECELADEEFRKEFHIARKDISIEFYKAGMKKVMEWVENMKGEEDYTDSEYQRRTSILLDKEAWQAFKEEEGLW